MKVLGEKKKRKKIGPEKKERIPLCQVKKKDSFVKVAGTSGALIYASKFRTKKSLSNQNLPYVTLKARFPFLYASTSLDITTLTIALNVCIALKQYDDSLSYSSAHFAVFPFLPRVFHLPLATLLIIVSCSSTLHWAIEIIIIIINQRVCNGNS